MLKKEGRDPAFESGVELSAVLPPYVGHAASIPHAYRVQYRI